MVFKRRSPGECPLPPFWNRTVITLIELLLILSVSSCKSGASPGDPGTTDETQQLQKRLAELSRQEQTLNAEYPLARNPAPYLTVDLWGRSIDLKAQGRILRSFKIADIRRSAPGEKPIDTWILVDKKPLQRNQRPKITPGAGEQATAAAQQALWGPHRMPSDYDLIFEGSKILEIRSLPSEQSGTRILRALESVYLRTVDWYRHWSSSKDSEPQYMLQIWLTENDSQSLFWSLPKQLNALIIG